MTSIIGKRPAFRIGEKFPVRMPPLTQEMIQKSLPIPRSVDIRKIRPQFEISAPAPRKIEGINDIQALLKKQRGITVSLGEESLRKLLEVEIPQVDDQGRRILDSSGNPVMVKKLVNIGELSKSTTEGLDKLGQLVANEASATGRNLQDLENRIALEVGNVIQIAIDEQRLDTFTPRNLQLLKRAIKTLDIPRDAITANLPVEEGMFITQEGWNQQKATILMWLISTLPNRAQLPGERNVASPAIGIRGLPVKMDRIDASFREGKVLDIDNFQFFNDKQDIRDRITSGSLLGPRIVRSTSVPLSREFEVKQTEIKQSDLADLASSEEIENLDIFGDPLIQLRPDPEVFAELEPLEDTRPRRSARLRRQGMRPEISMAEFEQLENLAASIEEDIVNLQGREQTENVIKRIDVLQQQIEEIKLQLGKI